MAEGIEGVFGETGGGSAPQDAAQAAESADKVEGVSDRTVDLAGGTAAPRAPGGRPEHIPEKFWTATEADPTVGEVNTKAWAKAWKDAETFASRLKRENDEFRKGGKVGTAPDKVEDYWTGYDTEGLKKAAPKAYLGGDGDNATLKSFFQSAQGAGVPVEAARKMFHEFMVGLNGAIPDEKDAATLRKEAAAALGPNGAKMAEDVKAYLGTHHARTPFTADELAELGEMVKDKGGLSLLWTLSRGTGRTTPPPAAAAGTSDVYSLEEIEQAMVSPRYATDDAYRSRIDKALMARNAALKGNGAADMGTSVERSLSL